MKTEGEWVDLLEKDTRQNRSGVVLKDSSVEQGGAGRVPGPGAIEAFHQTRAAARNGAKPPASRAAREEGTTDRR